MAGIGDVAKGVGAKPEIVKSVFEEVVRLASGGEKVTIAGFGTFTVYERSPRTARNPKTGEPIDVPAQNVLRLKGSKTLKETLNP